MEQLENRYRGAYVRLELKKECEKELKADDKMMAVMNVTLSHGIGINREDAVRIADELGENWEVPLPVGDLKSMILEQARNLGISK